MFTISKIILLQPVQKRIVEAGPNPSNYVSADRAQKEAKLKDLEV